MDRTNSLQSGTRARRRASHFAFMVALLVPVIVGPCSWGQGTVQSSAPHDVRLDVRDAHGLTPLILAASTGQTETVRSLLAQGAGIDARSTDGRTALIAAVQGGQMEAVQALVAGGANLNAATRGTGTALEVAERTGKTDIAALLLASGARSSGHSVGDTVCVLPWGGDGFCGTVKSFSVRSVSIDVTKIMGCTNGCSARQECSAAKSVGGVSGLQRGLIAVPSWCLTETGVKP